jgi:hypothetical protein
MAQRQARLDAYQDLLEAHADQDRQLLLPREPNCLREVESMRLQSELEQAEYELHEAREWGKSELAKLEQEMQHIDEQIELKKMVIQNTMLAEPIVRNVGIRINSEEGLVTIARLEQIVADPGSKALLAKERGNMAKYFPGV